MKYVKLLSVCLLAGYANIAIGYETSTNQTDKRKWTLNKEKEFFVDIGAGYSFYKPKLQHSFDSDFIGITKKNGDSNNHQNSAIYTIAIGRELSKDFSIKLEATHNSKFNNKFDKLSSNPTYTNYIAVTDQSSTRIVINGEYDFYHFNKQLSVFVDAGLGFAMNHTSNGDIYTLFTDYDYLADEHHIKTFSNLNYPPTWQIGTGLKYKATEKLSFSLSYRYIDFGTFTSSSNFYRYHADIGNNENKGRYANDKSDRLKFKLTSHNILLTARIKL